MTPERINKIRSVLDKRQGSLTVVLENVFDPHNISAVMRSCDAVGVQEVYILHTQVPRNHQWRNRISNSTARWLTIHHYTDVAACFEALHKRYAKILTTHLSGGAIDLYAVDFTQSIALVFGNEHTGVSEEARALADGNFIIPQVGMIQSLNISVACAVSLYEAFRQKRMAGHYTQPQLSANAYSALGKEWGLNEDGIDS